MLDKIREVLKKHGLEEEEVGEVVTELTETAPADDKSDDPVDDTPAPADDTSAQEGDDAPKGDVPPADDSDVPPADSSDDVKPESDDDPSADDVPADDVPPSDNAPKGDLPEGMEEIDPVNPPVDDTPAPDVDNPIAPTPDVNPEIVELRSKLEESEKKCQGLASRVDLLEEALKSAGIMEETSKSDNAEVGIDDPSRTPDFNDDAEIDLDDVVAEINKARR